MSIYYRLPLPVRRAIDRARCLFRHDWLVQQRNEHSEAQVAPACSLLFNDLMQRRKCQRCAKRQYRSAVALVYGVNEWHSEG